MRFRTKFYFLLSLACCAGALAFAPHKQAAPLPPASVGALTLADGLASPIALVSAHDGTGRLFVVDQVGIIRTLPRNGPMLPQPFLDLRHKVIPLNAGYDERGLLGLAFHPDFATNGRFFVYYNVPLRASAPAGWDDTIRLSEFTVSADHSSANSATERVLLEIDKPYFNHNGGTIAFGPDGYLYLSIGDGGNKNDIGLGHTPGLGNSQDLTKLLGKILRLDVDHGSPYGIPADNPFVGTTNRPEIYAYGFRNPYRFAFDSGGNHDLMVGDAGQSLWEEIDRVSKGGNYGWHIKEGTHCFDPVNEFNIPSGCPNVGAAGEPLIDPVIEYPNASNPLGGIGVVNVAGHFYHGGLMPALQNFYVFGDFSKDFTNDGTLLVATPQAAGLWPLQPLRIAGSPDGRLHHFIKGFGQGDDGEIYVLATDALGPTGSTGKVLKLVPVFNLQTQPTLARQGDIQATVTMTNAGTSDVSGVKIVRATLGGVNPVSLPPAIGTLAVGASQTFALHFPAAAGLQGASSVLRLSGTSSGGAFGASCRVTLP